MKQIDPFMDFERYPESAMVSLCTAALLSNLSATTARRLAESGSFPRVIKISRRISGVRVADLRQYLSDPEKYIATSEVPYE